MPSFKKRRIAMGRAIDMEKDIEALKLKVETLENQLRGMVSKIDDIDEDLDEIYEKSSKTKHIDLTEVKDETEKEKTDNEGDGKSDKPANSSKSKSSKKSK